MRPNTHLAIAATVLLAAMTGSAHATGLRVSGAATVARGIIIPNQASIEQ
jgi:hypothetical protein